MFLHKLFLFCNLGKSIEYQKHFELILGIDKGLKFNFLQGFSSEQAGSITNEIVIYCIIPKLNVIFDKQS